MAFYIYRDGIRIGILQNVSSVQWLENYQSPGEAKIVADVTDENLELLVIGNRIYNPDTGAAMIIQASDLQEKASERSIVIRAVSPSVLLEHRVVMATEKIQLAEAGIYSIYSKNRRDLPIGTAAPKGYTNVVDTEITWKSCLEAINTISESSGLGYRINFNPTNAAETFEVYLGVDRTIQGSANYVGYFGTDVGNISDIRIIVDDSDYKNVAIVAGEDKGTVRKVRTVSLAANGEERRELFVDARDLQTEYRVAKDTGKKDDKGNPIHEYEEKTYTEAEYNAMLDTRGKEKLQEHLKKYDVTCNVEQNNLIYGVDYFLGDKMPVKLPRYQIKATAVVSAIKLVYEASGCAVTATLNNFTLEE